MKSIATTDSLISIANETGFIDTNILIDFIENRPGVDAAEKVLEKAANKVFSIFASPLTFANIAYILGKRLSKQDLYPMLDALEKQIEVLPCQRILRLLSHSFDDRNGVCRLLIKHYPQTPK